MPKTAKDQILLLAVGALLFFANLGTAPLWDRDEPRNAGCTAEMLDRGEFIVPIFNDELRTHKPILLYWLMMCSYSIFGVTEFAARAVSATVGLGTVLLTYHLARQMFDRRVARWAGLILCSTIMFSVASRAATPDALLIFCSTLAIYFFVRGSEFGSHDEFKKVGAERWLPRGLGLVAMYAAMGLGVLAKGPVGLVLPTAVIGMYLLLVRLPSRPAPVGFVEHCERLLRPFMPRHFLLTCWRMRPLTAFFVAGLVALPWYAWVHIRTDGVWTHEFLLIHNVSRASETMEGHAGPPILFYVAIILVGFFPWSILAIPTWLSIVRSQKSSAEHRAFVFLACWVAVYIGVFSVAQTKLPSYVTPCYPALAVMVAHFMAGWSSPNPIGAHQRLPTSWLKVGLAHWVVVGGLLLIGLPIAASRWLSGSQWLGIIGCVPLVGAIVCWVLLVKANQRAAASVFAITSVSFVGLIMALVPAELGRHRDDQAMLAQIGRHDGPIVAFGHLEPSWIFYGGKPIREFKAEEQAELGEFLASHDNALLLTTDRRLALLADRRIGLVSAKSPTKSVESEPIGTEDQSYSFDQLRLLKAADSGEIVAVATYETVHETEYFLRDRSLLLLRSVARDLGVANRPGPKESELRRPY